MVYSRIWRDGGERLFRHHSSYFNVFIQALR